MEKVEGQLLSTKREIVSALGFKDKRTFLSNALAELKKRIAVDDSFTSFIPGLPNPMVFQEDMAIKVCELVLDDSDDDQGSQESKSSTEAIINSAELFEKYVRRWRDHVKKWLKTGHRPRVVSLMTCIAHDSRHTPQELGFPNMVSVAEAVVDALRKSMPSGVFYDDELASAGGKSTSRPNSPRLVEASAQVRSSDGKWCWWRTCSPTARR